jgi:hypothetical protein
MRAAKIKIHDLAQKIAIQLIQRERHNEEQREADRQESARKEHEEEVRRQAERKELEMKLKRKWDEADVFRQIHTKRLKTMERVTAVGFSSAPGDAIVKGIGGDGTIELIKPLCQEEGTITIKDPRKDDSSHIFTLMCLASDKYEAAISLYHCACHDSICHCTRALAIGN